MTVPGIKRRIAQAAPPIVRAFASPPPPIAKLALPMRSSQLPTSITAPIRSTTVSARVGQCPISATTDRERGPA